jgi:hypothetical protein
MKKRILIILFLCFYILGSSQNKDSLYPNFVGKHLTEIKQNPNWKLLEKVSGDLDNDDLDDMVLILESKDSIPEKRCLDCKLLKNKPRIILVLFNLDGKLKVKIQNNEFIARGDEGGMSPYIEPELSIKNGLFSIYYQFTRSNQSYTFKYKNNRIEIVKAESMGVHSASGNYENDKFDFTNGTLTSETGNISEEESESKIVEFEKKPKSLSEFGPMYEWEITEYKYL